MTDHRKLPRRRHSAQLKAQVLAECARPEASVAAVAMAHGLNANVVHKWRRQAAGTASLPVATFVPVSVKPAVSEDSMIRIELHRGVTVVNIAWPVAASAECAQWLRELLK
jgi:transposase